MDDNEKLQQLGFYFSCMVWLSAISMAMLVTVLFLWGVVEVIAKIVEHF